MTSLNPTGSRAGLGKCGRTWGGADSRARFLATSREWQFVIKCSAFSGLRPHSLQVGQYHPGKTRHGPDRWPVCQPPRTHDSYIPITNTYKPLKAARNRKSEKPLYLQLVSDLEDRGLSVSFLTLEIRSLGHFTSYAVKCLTNTFSLSKQHARTILSKLSKISIACSYHIFNARNSLSWDSNKPFYTL